MTTHSIDPGMLTRHPGGKMPMKVANSKVCLDFGTLLFLSEDDADKMPSPTQRVYYTREDIPVDNWQKYCVGMTTSVDGDESDDDGVVLVSTGISLDLYDFAEHLDWCVENSPSNTALLPFKYGAFTDGIPLSDLRGQVADVSVATGVNHFINSQI